MLQARRKKRKEIINKQERKSYDTVLNIARHLFVLHRVGTTLAFSLVAQGHLICVFGAWYDGMHLPYICTVQQCPRDISMELSSDIVFVLSNKAHPSSSSPFDPRPPPSHSGCRHLDRTSSDEKQDRIVVGTWGVHSGEAWWRQAIDMTTSSMQHGPKRRKENKK